MALNISLLSIDKQGLSITFQDSSSSPVTTAASIVWKYWTAAAALASVNLTSGQVASLISAGGLAVTPNMVGLTAVAGAAFADGIHVVQITVNAGVWTYYVLVRAGAEACIVASIGQLSDRDFDCSKCEKQLQKLIRWRFAADIKRDLADYDAAHNLVLSIGNYCGVEDCDC